MFFYQPYIVGLPHIVSRLSPEYKQRLLTRLKVEFEVYGMVYHYFITSLLLESTVPVLVSHISYLQYSNHPSCTPHDPLPKFTCTKGQHHPTHS